MSEFLIMQFIDNRKWEELNSFNRLSDAKEFIKDDLQYKDALIMEVLV